MHRLLTLAVIALTALSQTVYAKEGDGLDLSGLKWRNLGPAFAHCLLALDSACRGLGKLEVDETRLNAELDKAWEVLAEAIQTVMRRYNVPEPYEKLKALTRGRSEIDAATLRDFVTALPIPKAAQDSLAALTPQTYTGNAAASVRMFLQERHQHH